jgi:hypothetical protein
MTFLVTLGIDPGQTGAIAALADGEFASVHDMPVKPRKAGGMHIDDEKLASIIREILTNHPGAFVHAALEMVSARPKQNISAMFRFGESYGIVKGILGTIGVPRVEVHPAKWKNFVGLRGTDKDAARALAGQRFPNAVPFLKRKKDIGRADAIMIAYWRDQDHRR